MVRHEAALASHKLTRGDPVEGSQHLGQVAYLRGLQRGLEYPTSWVSSRTPWPEPRLQCGR
jgi:hypothetical protein